MELREAGHTQLLANFARFFKAKRDQGSYEVLSFCSSLLAGLYLPSNQHAAGRSCDPGFLGATGGGRDVHTGGGQGEPLHTGRAHANPRAQVVALLKESQVVGRQAASKELQSARPPPSLTIFLV